MCNRQPGRRLSAKQALGSAWFMPPELQRPQSNNSPGVSTTSGGSQSIPEAMGNNIKEFSSLSDFQKVAFHLAAYRLDDMDVLEELNMFKVLDRNNDGRLTLDEFSQGCWGLGLSDPEVEALFK